jgi:hypothetical protein
VLFVLIGKLNNTLFKMDLVEKNPFFGNYAAGTNSCPPATFKTAGQ